MITIGINSKTHLSPGISLQRHRYRLSVRVRETLTVYLGGIDTLFVGQRRA